MGIYVTVNLDIEPLTAELLFPLGLPAGSSIDLIVAPPSLPKAKDRKRPFSLCHALVCGRKVPIARNNFDKSFEAPSVPKGLCVRSPVVNGQRMCLLKNVRKGTSTRSVTNAVPQTPLAPVDTVVADNPEKCKRALEDIIKAGETKTVFVCTECPHRTFDKEEAVEHCKSHLASTGTADAAKAVPRLPPKRGTPPKERFHCNTCTKSFPSKQSLQTHLLNHTSRGTAVPLVTTLKSASNVPPRSEPANSPPKPVSETASDCLQTLVSCVLEGYANPSQSISVPDDSSVSGATVYTSHGTAVPLVTTLKSTCDLPPRSESASSPPKPVSETASDCLQALVSCVLEGYANPSQSISVSGDSSVSGATVYTSHGTAVPLVTTLKSTCDLPPRSESANSPREPVSESTSDCPQTVVSCALKGYANPSQSASISGDSSISGATVLSCVGCTEMFASLSDLDSHRQSAHPDTHFCHICGELFGKAIHLESHVTATHGKGICFYCTLCLRVFLGEESFKEHKAQCGVVCATSKRKRREFICSHCSFITDSYSQLCDHVVEKHPNVSVHQCESCQKPFLHSAMLEHHRKTVHDNTGQSTATRIGKNSMTRLYPCTFCDRVFKSYQGIRAHTNIHKNLRPFECRKCGASLTSLNNLKAHMVCIHGSPGDNAKCPHCPKVFKLKRSLSIHMRAIHSQQGRRQCELCGKWLSTERKLQRHVALTHYGDSVDAQDTAFSLLRLLKCNHCDFQSFSYSRLARHRVTHTGVYPHQCPECNKQFVFRDQLTRHVQSVHRKVRLTCQQCPRLFFSEKLFQQHLDAHRLGQGFPCTMCNNFYETKAALDHHSQSHEAGLPFQCELCQKRFKHSQGLSIHRRYWHNQESRSSSRWRSGDHTWRHSCDVCRIRFKYQSSLAAHRLNRHTDTERLTCPYCSRRFNSLSVLALHIRSHTGEKPHVCPHCSKAFSIPTNLKNHIITQHTKEFKFFCPLCSKGAVSQIKLRQHLLQSHKATNGSSSKYKRAVTTTEQDTPDMNDFPISQVAVEDAVSILSQIFM
ncbi:uncharacterized protein LOC119182282 [Rhipicephalus microplus]|uniref:uncharacterized protein LOC119182282 n=1 Tax=Rhipicephalus microplus TaxID=6941 RepID=UPI003F6B4D8A